MYTSLEDAKEEIWKRWNDEVLRQKVLEYVGELPPGFGLEPVAALARPLATSNFEFQSFVAHAVNSGLRPYCLEYLGDKFCSINEDKRSLARMSFYHGKGRHNGLKITTYNIISFCSEDGKPFRKVRTIWNEDITAFHHKLLLNSVPSAQFNDFTNWLERIGGTPRSIYPKFMSLFICYGILFENFVDKGSAKAFTNDVVWPAIRSVTQQFGLNPLIVPVVPVQNETEPFWSWYPGQLEDDVKALLEGQHKVPKLSGLPCK